ncbi:hypothetical protein [Paratractidigestivibacter sp.]|uniref:hypothetical protein n=1 Tax=Paratractidigestivibacter sp. TaxID=2847316 RepID=UPI002AC9266D|nr:hypothetical protein [Paratractidigestivibacter sp.]
MQIPSNQVIEGDEDIIIYDYQWWRVEWHGTAPALVPVNGGQPGWYCLIGEQYRNPCKLVINAHKAWAYYQGWCAAKERKLINEDFTACYLLGDRRQEA